MDVMAASPATELLIFVTSKTFDLVPFSFSFLHFYQYVRVYCREIEKNVVV